MNEFDRRWQLGAESARQTEPQAAPDLPPGFATRVVAQWRSARNSPPPLLLLWDLLSRRTLACLAVVLLITAAVSWPTDGQGSLARPQIENTMSDLLFNP